MSKAYQEMCKSVIQDSEDDSVGEVPTLPRVNDKTLKETQGDFLRFTEAEEADKYKKVVTKKNNSHKEKPLEWKDSQSGGSRSKQDRSKSNFLDDEENDDIFRSAENDSGPFILQIGRGQMLRMVMDELKRENKRPNLPPLKVPMFSGKTSEWRGFFEMFSHVIHNDPNHCDTDKMSYLLSYLEGDAKRLVSHLSPTGDHYKAALDLLRNRYDHKRKTTFDYVNLLLDVRRVEYRSAKDIVDLHDRLNEALAGLGSLGYRTEHWDPLIIGMCIRKLDDESIQLFEQSLDEPTEVPTVKQFLKFLFKRHLVLSSIRNFAEKKKGGKDKIDSNKSYHSTSTKPKMACFLCKKEHTFASCPRYLELTSDQRLQMAIKLDLCLNYLGHKKDRDKECTKVHMCKQCDEEHHETLHFEEEEAEPTDALVSIRDNKDEFEERLALHAAAATPLFPTALLKVKQADGSWTLLRALIDTGSGDSFISERAAQDLALPRVKINAPIRRIAGAPAPTSRHQICLTMAPRFPSTFQLELNALVLSSLTGFLPQTEISSASYKSFNVDNILIADPCFMTPGPIDLILGSRIYAAILKEGIKKAEDISAQNTELGWMLMGAHKPKEIHVISMVATTIFDGEINDTGDLDQEIKPVKEQHGCEKEFVTVLKRIEATLNSMSLSPAVGDSADLAALIKLELN
ncbi:uncharacterized protein LOC132262653 [Phlebotomus argentipes]|uniref:uncharacterized protein LOC132262653 n=1 Tax=Phlebotomus argentipes TaxID=94469 RepID=UPI002892A102|nr:uncharacterized protein LOC132262653 [Phlebotomus argentipes]